MGTLQIWDSKIYVIYTKRIAKEKRQQQTNLENQLKILEKSLDEDHNLSKYKAMKNELDASYDHTTQPTFQRWINAVSTLYINVEITLIWR